MQRTFLKDAVLSTVICGLTGLQASAATPLGMTANPGITSTGHALVTTRLAQAPLNQIPQSRAAGIQVFNDPDTGGDVTFLVDDQQVSLQPGQAITLPPGRSYIVNFNSGGPAGDVRFSLIEGAYKFKVSENGWALYKSATPLANAAPPSQNQSSARGAASGPQPPLPAEDLRYRKRTKPAAPAQQKPADAAGHDGGVPAPPPPGVTSVSRDGAKLNVTAPPLPIANDPEAIPQRQRTEIPPTP